MGSSRASGSRGKSLRLSTYVNSSDLWKRVAGSASQVLMNRARSSQRLRLPNARLTNLLRFTINLAIGIEPQMANRVLVPRLKLDLCAEAITTTAMDEKLGQ